MAQKVNLIAVVALLRCDSKVQVRKEDLGQVKERLQLITEYFSKFSDMQAVIVLAHVLQHLSVHESKES